MNSGTITGVGRMLCILLFALILSGISGCEKEKHELPPIVEIISPEELEVIYLPGVFNLHLRLTSSKSIKFIQVSIENYNQIPVFEPIQYYPDIATVEIKEELNYGLLPSGFHAPFYLHIKVIDASGTNNFFREISLINPDLKYFGFYLTTRPSINKTEVFYYDDKLNETSFVAVDGEYQETTASTYQDMFFLSTSIPAKLQAYNFEDQELAWEVLPDLPFPEFTDLYFKGNELFVGTANGRIKSFNSRTGNPGVTTKRLADSVPLTITVSEGYIIGDYRAKKVNSNALGVFYRATGILFQKRHLNFNVLDFYFEKYGFGFFVFGNGVQKGTQVLYQPLSNSIRDQHEFKEGIIKHVERYDLDLFFLNIEKKIFLFNTIDKSNKLVLTIDEDLVDMVYENINRNLYLVFSDRVEIYSYPGVQKIATQISPYPIKSIEIRKTY